MPPAFQDALEWINKDELFLISNVIAIADIVTDDIVTDDIVKDDIVTDDIVKDDIVKDDIVTDDIVTDDWIDGKHRVIRAEEQ